MTERTMCTLKQVVEEHGVVFGTSGARGLVSALTPTVCHAYTSAFLQSISHLCTSKTLAIAIDLRPSSRSIAEYCVAAAYKAGWSVIYCGEIPTPALALYAQTMGVAGIMVTGSHIPFDRNGLKFYRPDGEISKADEQAMLQSTVLRSDGHQATLLPDCSDTAKTDYIARYTTLYAADALSGMHIGVYQHSSVSRDVMAEVLQALGASITTLERSNIFIPIDTEAVSEADMAKGLAWSAEFGFDAIVTTDGDGDRPLIGDEHGQWLRGDIVGLLTAYALNIETLAIPVSCNTAIERSGFFKKVMRTRIGSPFVIAAMQELAEAQINTSGAQTIAGFEANGGFLLGTSLLFEHGHLLTALPTRDALLPVVAILILAKQQACGISTLLSRLPKRFTASDRLQNFPVESSQHWLAKWSHQPEAFLSSLGIQDTVSKVDQTDGLRMTLINGDIIHLRPSGNAPELRCYTETSNAPESRELVSKVLAFISRLHVM